MIDFMIPYRVRMQRLKDQGVEMEEVRKLSIWEQLCVSMEAWKGR